MRTYLILALALACLATFALAKPNELDLEDKMDDVEDKGFFIFFLCRRVQALVTAGTCTSTFCTTWQTRCNNLGLG